MDEEEETKKEEIIRPLPHSYSTRAVGFSKMRILGLLTITIFALTQTQTTKKTINAGVLFSKDVARLQNTIGYRTSAGALLVARKSIETKQILPGYEIKFSVAFDECNELLATEETINFMRNQSMDVIIGPSCNSPALTTGIIGAVYNIPVINWGLVSASQMADIVRFPTNNVLTPNTLSLGIAVRRIVRQFEWKEFAFLYSGVGDTEKCPYLKTDLEIALSDMDDFDISYYRETFQNSVDEFRLALRAIRRRARVVIVCLTEGYGFKRNLMLATYDEKMLGDEFLFIYVDTKSRGYYETNDLGIRNNLWTSSPNDGRDKDAFEAFRRTLAISDMIDYNVKGENVSKFREDTISLIKNSTEFPCPDCQNLTSLASLFSGQLHDALMVYAYSLNQTLTATRDPTQVRNGTAMLRHGNVSFDGFSGPVTMFQGTRCPTFYLYGLNSSGEVVVWADVYVEGTETDSATLTKTYSDDATGIWAERGGNRPKSVPDCGFDDNCPLSFTEQYLVWVIVAVIIIGGAIIALFCGGVYIYHSKRQEKARLNMLWQISIMQLKKVQTKSKGEQSVRSLQSAVSGPSTTSTKFTIESKTETKNFAYYVFNKEHVVALKHHGRPRMDENDYAEMRQMRQLDHDNLNRFIGLVTDGPVVMSLWKFCGRGSLQDVIAKGSMTMDNFFVYSLLRDISNGLSFIHHSFLKAHGFLSSECCLIDDRWQVKISYYGIRTVQVEDKRQKKDLLWTAPEVLRGEVLDPTPEGDIYSFGIVCSELITKKGVFDLENRKEKPDELIYMLKKGGSQPMRPELSLGENHDINPAMLHLVRDCWSEIAHSRPDIDTVRSLMKSMNSGRNDNLMDHVFNQLENYATHLEEEVEERMKELVEEKKKSDILLYRMLPKQVAEKLKLGQTVSPEHFESVTIFFSDVVSFTKLAARCTPLQVVNLLNDLYSIFDGIIEEHDVYKVETIGDGYLCVSGLPHRNGNQHISEIADMSIGFLRSLTTFRVPHLPSERINLRIGMHTGSCVAGVVGMTMPRYCLFGDTVNTASRMESNGKPGHIHMSGEAHSFMSTHTTNYVTETRGEVIIKGKGVMETFWLFGTTDDFPTNSHSYSRETRSDDPIAAESTHPARDESENRIDSYPTPPAEKKETMYNEFVRQETIPVQC